MDLLKEALSVLPSVATSPMAFVGYLATILAWVWAISRSQRFKLLLSKLKDIPESDRAIVIQHEMGAVLPAKVSAEQWIRAKKQQYFFLAFVLLLLTTLSIIAISVWKGGAQLKIDSVQEVLPPLQTAQDNENIPGELSKEKLRLNQVLPESKRHRYIFDVTLRNPSSEPVTVTDIRIIFDPGTGGGLANVEEISGTYVVRIDENGATTTGPVGRFQAYAWYPSGQGRLHVKSPLSQTVKPQSTDRFRIIIEFPQDYSFRGTMEEAILQVLWNGSEYEKSQRIRLAKK